MKTGGSVFVLAIAALTLGSVPRAQSLTLAFRDHSGALHTDRKVPVGRTGDWVGTLTMPVSASDSLAYAWGYYVPGAGLFYLDNDGAGTTPCVYRRVNANTTLPLLDSTPTQKRFEVRLPYAYEDQYEVFPGLGIGTYDLKLWVGNPAAFDFDSPGPPVGVLAQFTQPIEIESKEFIVWIDHQRTLTAGTSIQARIVLRDDAPAAQYYEIVAGGVASTAVSQVMIPAGSSSSLAFQVDIGSTIGEGTVGAIRNGESFIAIVNSVPEIVMAQGEILPPGEIIGTLSFSYCSQTAAPVSFGPESTRCSDCSTSPSLPQVCTITGASGFHRLADCSFSFTTDCEVYSATMTLSAYTVTSTSREVCGTLIQKPGGSVEAKIGVGGVSIGGELGVAIPGSTTLNLYQQCCVLRFDGNFQTEVEQCRTVD